MSKPSLSLIVPVFNEAESLPEAVACLRSTMQELATDYEILVVESGSTDGTKEIADKLSAAHREVRVVHETERNGFGSALRIGFSSARCDLVCVVPADLPYELEAIGAALELVATCDAVLSERRTDERSGFRRFQSWVYATLCWILLDLPRTSPNAAFKLYRRHLVAGMPIQSRGWFIDTEVVYRLRTGRARIRTLKVDVLPRQHGSSSVTLADSLRMFRQLVAFCWKVRHEKSHG